MEIQVPYGHSFLTGHIPDGMDVDIIEPPDIPATNDPQESIVHALDNLLGGLDWARFSEAKSVAVAVNDKTRPVPHHYLLPPLLERLSAIGIPNPAITFYVAVGTHPPMTPNEFPDVLPAEILKRYKVVSHDSENDSLLIHLGETSRGTSVNVNKGYFESDFMIVIGNIEPHQFVGFSGGVKSAAIGLSSLETINQNHTLMTHPDSKLGEYTTNPARQDVEEIGKMMDIHLALNVILNQRRQIVRVLAGEPQAVMQAGIPISREVCQVSLSAPYSLIISSPGGHPKDINIYQSQKGLAHAALVTQPGGTIILTAACPEGTGSPHYENWMMGKSSYTEVIEIFNSEGFRIGAHKAYQIARDASRVHLMFCSEMEDRLARALLLNPVKDFQTALDLAIADLKPGDRIGVLPHASTTIPYLKE